MKKILFTLMMIAGLAMVANTTFGQDKVTPYEGSKHSYTVAGVDIGTGNVGTVSVYLSSTNSVAMDIDTDAAGLEWGLSDGLVTTSGGAISLVSNTHYSGALTDASTGVTFDITYTGTSLSLASRYIVVNVVVTDECSNFIVMKVDPIDAPSLELAVTSDVTGTTLCQALATSPADVTAASVGQTNTIVYDITPSAAITAGDTWSGTFIISGTAGYTFTITDSGASGFTGIAGNTVTVTNATGALEITVEWTTTVNAAGTVIGTVAGSLTAQGIAAPITATYNPEFKSVTYLETPAIGSFN